jgi:hypothetical protein
VVVFISAPREELGDRKELSLPHEYEPWVRKLDEIVYQVEHHEAAPTPDALLVGEVIIAPKDIAGRMKYAERWREAHEIEHFEQDEAVDDRLYGGAERDKLMAGQIDRLDRGEADDFYDLAIENDRLTDELTRLQDFVTRKPRFKRAWEKNR